MFFFLPINVFCGSTRNTISSDPPSVAAGTTTFPRQKASAVISKTTYGHNRSKHSTPVSNVPKLQLLRVSGRPRVSPTRTSNVFGKRPLAVHRPKSATRRTGLRPTRASSTVRRVLRCRYHTDGRIEYDRNRPHPLTPSYSRRTTNKNVYRLLQFNF